VITIPERHTRTDGQTDGRATYDGNTALCTKVHRAVKRRDYNDALETFKIIKG